MASAPPQESLDETATFLPQGLAARLHLVRFAGFAAAAIAINLMSQNAVLLVAGGVWFGIYLAIAFGNAAGLVFKYICDKHWVFGDDAPIQSDGAKFGVYALFGVLTTAIFWAVELSFHYVFQTAFMTNVGGVIGLSIGYVVKYNLDKRVTFRTAMADRVPGRPSA